MRTCRSSETFYLDALEFSDISDAQTFAGQGHGMKRSPECFQGNRGSAEKEGDEAPKGENCESENDGVLFGGIPLQIDSGYLGDSERRGRLESMEEVSTLVEEDGEMEASLCGRLVLEGMAPDQVALLFEENRVSIMDCIGPTGEVEDPDALMVRINGVIYPWSDMMASDIRAMKMSDTELDIFWDAASQQGDSSAPEEPSTEILVKTLPSVSEALVWSFRVHLASQVDTLEGCGDQTRQKWEARRKVAGMGR